MSKSRDLLLTEELLRMSLTLADVTEILNEIKDELFTPGVRPNMKRVSSKLNEAILEVNKSKS